MPNLNLDSTITEDIQDLIKYMLSSIQIIGGAIAISGIVIAVTPLVLLTFTGQIAQKAILSIIHSNSSRNRR